MSWSGFKPRASGPVHPEIATPGPLATLELTDFVTRREDGRIGLGWGITALSQWVRPEGLWSLTASSGPEPIGSPHRWWASSGKKPR
jgi:hypothetical protein